MEEENETPELELNTTLKSGTEFEEGQESLTEITTLISKFKETMQEKLNELKTIQTNEILVLRDLQKGFQMELQSSRYDVQQLVNIGWMAWQNFFILNKSNIPQGVG